jgi:hypothetical protein
LYYSVPKKVDEPKAVAVTVDKAKIEKADRIF